MQSVISNVKTKVDLINTLSLKASQYGNFLLFFYECIIQEKNKKIQIKLFNENNENPDSRLLDEITIKLEDKFALSWLESLLELIYQKAQYKINFIEKTLAKNDNLYTYENETKTYILSKLGKKYFNSQPNSDILNYCNWNIFSFLASFYHIYYQDNLDEIKIANDSNMILNKINELIKANHEKVGSLKLIDWFLFFEIAIIQSNDKIKIEYNLINNKKIIKKYVISGSLVNIAELKLCLNVVNYLVHLNNDILALIRRLILDVINKFLEYNKHNDVWSLSILGNMLVENISYQQFIEKLIDYKIEKIRGEQ